MSKNAAILENNIVVSIISVDADVDPTKFGAIWCPEYAGVGDTFDGTTWSCSAEAAYNAALAYSARERRNQLLIESDWAVVSDSALSDDDKALWIAYRKSLRDVPSQDGFPESINWPNKPE